MTVIEVMQRMIRSLPAEFVKTITWDQGQEMAQHRAFTVATGCEMYFCDPHSPWQRGSNENTRGLLRQYFPKGTSLANVTQEQLDAFADELNGRPRQTPVFYTPSEKFAEAIAMTA